MGMAYNPDQRANDFQVEYKINTAGDRWFIPYNDNASMADQVTQCNKVTGHTADDTDCGSAATA